MRSAVLQGHAERRARGGAIKALAPTSSLLQLLLLYYSGLGLLYCRTCKATRSGAIKALATTTSLLHRLTTTLLQDMQSDALGAIKALASNARVRDTLLSGSHFTGFTGTKVPILTTVCAGVERARARPRCLQVLILLALLVQKYQY